MKCRIVFETPRSGAVSVRYGRLLSPAEFKNAVELFVECGEVNLKPGGGSTIVTAGEFSCCRREVNSGYPVYVPDAGAAALPAEDPRSYMEIALAVASGGARSDFAQVENEPEMTLEKANSFTRSHIAQTWLGVGPDIRGFWVDYNDIRGSKIHQLGELDFRTWGYIAPATHQHCVSAAPGAEPYFLDFLIGPGVHAAPSIARSLEDGFLPILRSTQRDGAVDYDITAFATLESHLLSKESVKGTPNDVAYAFNGYPGQCRIPHDEVFRRRAMLDRSEEVVLLMKVRARNTGKAPAYAFFSASVPMYLNYAENCRAAAPMKYTLADGILSLDEYDSGCVAVNLLNGTGVREDELSVLVMPGEEAVFEIRVPNGPVSRERAKAIARLDYDLHYRSCRAYWNSILKEAAPVSLPEKELENRLKAGILHTVMATTGEQSGPMMADVGLYYTPIGSESAPMILCYDWLGMPSRAARCLEYFIGRLDERGALFTYSNYENETGPFLWTAAEHFRYTRDAEWIRRYAEPLKRACNYLLEWRNANKTDECRAAGCYGLQKGKVDDPDDFYHSFYLNAGSYAGLAGMADALACADPDYAAFLRKECAEYRADIIDAIHAAKAKSPAIPTPGGDWVQHLPPWTEYTGDPAYHADGGTWTDHGTILYRVQTNPPVYCGIFGVLDCRSAEMDAILRAEQSPHTVRFSSYCQPYYVRNDYAFAIRGEVKPYLSLFYTQLAAMQDRETYTFYEHYYSKPFKGHEECWMLMQLRWMLFLEDGAVLNLCACAPRRWFAAGKTIELKNVCSKFGRLSFRIESTDAEIRCEYSAENAPESIRIRLPHASHRKAVRWKGGVYEPAAETVIATGKSGTVTLEF